ncbi:14787_t:CDS:2, partial [Dentiscutata heterogama]
MTLGLANKEPQEQDQKQLNNKILEETIQTINQFEEEVFPQAKSSNRKGKQVKIPSRSPNPKIEEKFEQLRTKLYQIQHHYNYALALDNNQLEE